MIKKKLMSVVLADISMLMLVSCGNTTLQKYIQENSADSIKETSAVQSEIKTQQNTESQQSIVQQGKELQQSDVQQQSTELQQSTGQQNTELVSDAYSDVIFDDYYSHKLNCYHIPQVSLSNGRAYDINAKMYNELNTILQKNVYYGDKNDKNYYPYITQMSYSWGQDKGIISIIANIYSAAGAGSYKFILNTSTGQKETFNCSIDHAE